MPESPDHREWLETDGRGGFAMGTVEGAGGGVRTRRYHGLLVVAARSGDPASRTMLLNGFDAWAQTPNGRFDLTSQHYSGGGGATDVRTQSECEIESLTNDPWPRWVFRLGDGTRIQHELFMMHGSPLVAMSWKLCEPRDGVRLCVRPFLSGRDYHALHHENASFDFAPFTNNGGHVAWRPYRNLPALTVRSNGSYRHDPHWYRNFLYIEERARGFDCAEDLAAPGVFEFELSNCVDEAILLAAGGAPHDSVEAMDDGGTVQDCLEQWRASERDRRGRFASRLHAAADQYIVSRAEGKTIIAGYPWFADWGRDTFIAMRGLCLATERLENARQILLAWAGTISAGMLPNRFPDSSSGGGASTAEATVPEYNSVDASLWFVIAAYEFMQAADRNLFILSDSDRKRLQSAILEIVTGYVRGTRYGIRMDEDDGLLAAGVVGQQLTWMDARVNGHEVTPRIGKPVEVNALWLNALWIAAQFSEQWNPVFQRGQCNFRNLFWNERDQCLFDVIDEDHVVGKVDASLRPNQIFAVGGLPLQLLSDDHALAVVSAVEQTLLTPVGLRTLPQDDARYVPRYEGGPAERDAAYHQGTVWPWLIGPYVEAWVRVRGGTSRARRQARERFFEPILDHISQAGIGHISEITDGGPPHTPRGCPFQAWSVGELLRIDAFLNEDENRNSRARRSKGVGKHEVTA